MTEEYEMQVEQQLEKLVKHIRSRRSMDCEQSATAARLLLSSIGRNNLWILINTLRAATAKNILPDLAEWKVEGVLNANTHLQPYLNPWRELSQEVVEVWSKSDTCAFPRIFYDCTCHKEKILQLYSQYMILKQADEIEFPKYKEAVIASVLEAYNVPRETLSKAINDSPVLRP
ncbi:hypothetical protein [cf. Phormidesmis sp. LEGE 11477]|uniref:hypothetical protein n=1 Tax=cf. Phormidesmis sp. LEGE 11477 TaxID=1828680 RepID=UPI00187E446B|nr:hypothetical protein [cf. Phormidesmis sp. LEGE 11477]MBE9064116.1 hypothetical protein [cf. Phormidesmis sp. LEGE 11477]